jgi:DNA-directed RNA polymerase subunit L
LHYNIKHPGFQSKKHYLKVDDGKQKKSPEKQGIKKA